MRSEKWAHLALPFSKVFLADRESRDRVFGYFKELDKAGALDDLSYVLTSLNETNFFDGLLAVFTCAEDPTDSICEGRSPLLTKEEILKVLNSVELDEETIRVGVSTGADIISVLRNNEKKYQEFAGRVVNFPFFSKARLNFISAFAKRYIEGFSEQDISYFKNLFLAREEGSDNPWLYDWMRSPQMNKKQFDYVF